MENVAKALLLAGAVLIGVLLLYNFTSAMNTTGQFTESYTDKIQKDQTAQFNSDFTKYVATNMNMYEVVTLLNKVLYINEGINFDKSNLNYITVKLKFTSGSGTAYNSNEDFIAEYWDGTSFDYDEYQKAIFGLLSEYYDDTISWEGATSIDKPTRTDIPVFRISIDRYIDGKVAEITFTEGK